MFNEHELIKTKGWFNPFWLLKRLDWLSLCLILLLMAISLFTLKSSAGNEGIILRQVIRFAAAFAVFTTLLALPPTHLKQLTPFLYLLTLCLLVLVLILGVHAGGAQRWLNIGFMRLQPSEIAKLSVPMMVAWHLSLREKQPQLKHVCMSLLIIALPFYLVFKQPDLGTSILIAASGLVALFLAGLPVWMIMSGALILTIAIPLFWLFGIQDYQKERVLTLFNPEADPWGAGYHIIQSKIAIGSGGVSGKGFMQGTQSQLEFLPESSTDFIFSVIAEEQGLIGIIFLLLIYMALVLRGMYLSIKLTDRFARIVVGTIFFTFFLNVFVNIGMVSGILPVVGLPLALISYGGSSALSIMAGFALAMSLAHEYRYRYQQECL